MYIYICMYIYNAYIYIYVYICIYMYRFDSHLMMCWMKTKKVLKTHLFCKTFRFLYRNAHKSSSSLGTLVLQDLHLI